ncbi:MAG: DUF6174 domain-containing protein [Bacteroidetes bacterium]|nr:DUF6174 domain-containing protein [Bacteroidota bacterium]
MKKPGFILIIFLILILGCKKVTTSFDRSTFNEMKSKWLSLNIQNYSFKYTNGGMANFSNTYVVKNNIVAKIIPDTLHHIDTTKAYTIARLYDLIENIYENPYIRKVNNRTYCIYNQITTSYDSQFFFPTNCIFDYECKNMGVTDLGWGFNVTEFKLISK